MNKFFNGTFNYYGNINKYDRKCTVTIKYLVLFLTTFLI